MTARRARSATHPDHNKVSDVDRLFAIVAVHLGHTTTAVAAHLGVSRKAVTVWRAKHPAPPGWGRAR